MSQIRPMGPREWSMLVALSLLWGGSFFFIGVLVKELPTLTVALLRVGLAATALVLFLRLAGVSFPLHGEALRAYAGMGLLNNVVPFSLIVWAQASLPSGLAAILNATTPMFAVLVTHVLSRDERATALKLAGVCIGFVGVAAMLGLELLSGGYPLSPQVALLGAALFYAFAGMWGRRFARLSIPAEAAAAGQLCASSLMLLPLTLLIERPWTLPPPGSSALAAMLALALASTALAYVLYFRILAASGATSILLVTFLAPAGAILLGVAILGETLQLRHLLGMALIGAGLAFIDGRPIRGLLHKEGVI